MVQAHVVLEHGVASACVKCEIERNRGFPVPWIFNTHTNFVERVRSYDALEGGGQLYSSKLTTALQHGPQLYAGEAPALVPAVSG